MKQTFSIESNLIIKESLPKLGILCSNPERAHRLIDHFQHKKMIANSWGIKIYSVKYKTMDIFLGYVPMGAGGAGMGYFEAYAAGAEIIVRYGSDDSEIKSEDLYNFTLVECADNLVGIPAALEHGANSYDEIIHADAEMINIFKKTASELNINAQSAICHHVEDYHAYRFPEFIANNEVSDSVKKKIQFLESRMPHLKHCRDMESAALFFRAREFNKKAITVLQSVLKPNNREKPYTGEAGNISKSLEKKFLEWIMMTFEKI